MAEQETDSRDFDELEESLGGRVVAGCDTASVRDFIEAALD